VKYSEDQLRVIIDTIPTQAWSCSADGSTEFCNRRWLDYTGLSAEEALGWSWKVAIHPDDLTHMLEIFHEGLNSGQPWEVEARLRRFDGEFRWFLFRAVPLRGEQEEVVRWCGTNADIDDLRRAKEKLQHGESDLRVVIDTIPTMAFSALPDGSVDFVSQSWLDYTGFSMADWLGQGWRTYLASVCCLDVRFGVPRISLARLSFYKSFEFMSWIIVRFCGSRGRQSA
jgi:PAS domain S-box-containing protein